MSPGLALVGLSVIGTWGVASIAIIAAGVIMIFFPGEPVPGGSDNTLGGVFLLVGGLVSLGLMQMVVAPLLGIDPPLPIPAKKIIPHERMKRWVSAGKLTDYPDGLPKEIRLRSQRVVIVRIGNRAYALGALCSHARLPLAGFPGSPIKPYPVQEECITCPFHGAQFDVTTGKVVRPPFTSEWNEAHPFLGRLQSKLFFFNKRAEDMQTYPVKIEAGEIIVGLPR